jgi:class 3 adenylate cyclase
MERRLSAILAADIAGYSALMGADEARTVRDLKGHQAVVLPMVGEFAGRIIDTASDGILAEFASVINAVKCALAIQTTMAQRNAAIEPQRRMQLCVGINIGDVVYDDVRIYGDGINIAARLESIAEAGGICISSKVYEEISGRIDLHCEDLGEQQLKNIARPVRAYQVCLNRTSPIAVSRQRIAVAARSRRRAFRVSPLACARSQLCPGLQRNWDGVDVCRPRRGGAGADRHDDAPRSPLCADRAALPGAGAFRPGKLRDRGPLPAQSHRPNSHYRLEPHAARVLLRPPRARRRCAQDLGGVARGQSRVLTDAERARAAVQGSQ